MNANGPDPRIATSSPLRVGVVRRAVNLYTLVQRIQSYTKNWPEPLRYSKHAHIAGTDSDKGFERILREMLEAELPIGHVSGIRDLHIGDGREAAVVPQHELDLILRCDEGRLVIEAKAWQEEVGKEAVIVLIAKILDFMAAVNLDSIGPIFTGFIGLHGFSDSALRVMFAFGVIPFTQRAEQLSFRFVDMLLLNSERECHKQGWLGRERNLSEHRAALIPFLGQEGRDMMRTTHFDSDSIVVDLEGVRRASEMFDEGRAAHQQALACYREVRNALQVHSG